MRMATAALTAVAISGCGFQADTDNRAEQGQHKRAGMETAASSPAERVPAPAKADAGGVADPVAFVRSQYDAYIRASADRGAAIPDDRRALSEDLRESIARDRRQAGDMSPRLDFDYWIDGQDLNLTEVEIAELPATGEGRRIVEAAFDSGIPHRIRFHFKADGDRWFIDDIENVPEADQEKWSLRDILSSPPVAAE